MTIAIVWILAFFLGSIPFGLILAKIRKVDIRQHGSGNIGATNVARTLGKTAGIFTLVGDVGKGYLACWIADTWLGLPWQVAGAGLLAYMGHIYSVFLKFKGGKGVATGLGIFLFVMPLSAGSAAVLFILNLLVSRYVSISSIVAAMSMPIFGFLYHYPSPYIYIAVVTAFMTLYKHQDNINRLIQGTESKFIRK